MPFFTRLLLGSARERVEVPTLSVDFGRLAVCGLGREAERSEIERLLGAPAGWWSRRKGRFRYPALGLELRLQSDRLAGFLVTAGAAPRSPSGASAPFEGCWLPWNTDRPPSEAALIRALGRPSFRDCADEEISVEWARPGRFIGADYAIDGRLLATRVEFLA